MWRLPFFLEPPDCIAYVGCEIFYVGCGIFYIKCAISNVTCDGSIMLLPASGTHPLPQQLLCRLLNHVEDDQSRPDQNGVTQPRIKARQTQRRQHSAGM